MGLLDRSRLTSSTSSSSTTTNGLTSCTHLKIGVKKASYSLNQLTPTSNPTAPVKSKEECCVDNQAFVADEEATPKETNTLPQPPSQVELKQNDEGVVFSSEIHFEPIKMAEALNNQQCGLIDGHSNSHNCEDNVKLKPYATHKRWKLKLLIWFIALLVAGLLIAVLFFFFIRYSSDSQYERLINADYDVEFDRLSNAEILLPFYIRDDTMNRDVLKNELNDLVNRSFLQINKTIESIQFYYINQLTNQTYEALVDVAVRLPPQFVQDSSSMMRSLNNSSTSVVKFLDHYERSLKSLNYTSRNVLLGDLRKAKIKLNHKTSEKSTSLLETLLQTTSTLAQTTATSAATISSFETTIPTTTLPTTHIQITTHTSVQTTDTFVQTTQPKGEEALLTTTTTAPSPSTTSQLITKKIIQQETSAKIETTTTLSSSTTSTAPIELETTKLSTSSVDTEMIMESLDTTSTPPWTTQSSTTLSSTTTTPITTHETSKKLTATLTTTTSILPELETSSTIEISTVSTLASTTTTLPPTTTTISTTNAASTTSTQSTTPIDTAIATTLFIDTTSITPLQSNQVKTESTSDSTTTTTLAISDKPQEIQVDFVPQEKLNESDDGHNETIAMKSSKIIYSNTNLKLNQIYENSLKLKRLKFYLPQTTDTQSEIETTKSQDIVTSLGTSQDTSKITASNLTSLVELSTIVTELPSTGSTKVEETSKLADMIATNTKIMIPSTMTLPTTEVSTQTEESTVVSVTSFYSTTSLLPTLSKIITDKVPREIEVVFMSPKKTKNIFKNFMMENAN